MYQTSLIVRTKLTPPRPQKFTLQRPRLTQRLLDATQYRLTILHAGTGYGKSTALAALAEEPHPLVWYRLDGEDTDPQRFLTHLVAGFTAVLPHLSEAPMALLEEWSSNRTTTSWTAVIDTLINEFTRTVAPGTSLFLILDDIHHLSQTADPLRMLDRLIGLAPDNLHIILASRYPLSLPTLLTWRVKGEVLEIGQDELAFTPTEIDTLFRTRYSHALTLEQATLLINKIEGWPIALYLVWKNLQKDGGATFAEALAQLSGSSGDLFIYLTQEVLAQQPIQIQHFLRLTAVLRQMTIPACDHLREASDSQHLLNELLENGLFIVDLSEGLFRYHRLFHDLLYQQLPTEETQAAHRKAATYFQELGDSEEALYHWLSAPAFPEAADLLDTLGRKMVQIGRLDTLAGWIGTLPPEILAAHPPLLTYLGDISRLHSRFEQALGWYQQAEQRSRALGNIPGISLALRGQARVYLDTVNPRPAEELLREALRLSDGLDDRESRARLNELLAENLLNLGRAAEAKNYQDQAHALRQEGPSEVELPVRILLRTGRLDEARKLLEKQATSERQEPVLRPRAHRETLLLLSLILAFQGERDQAHQTAVEGTERGKTLHSEFVTAVGYMRQGHAWSLDKTESGYREAALCYQEAIRISEKLDVPRLKVEAFWGLCQTYGFRGDWETAEKTALRGIELARAAGDEWIEGLLRVTMGAVCTLAVRYEQATTWLAEANALFRECGDSFGETVARLWQCLTWYATDDTARLERDLAILLQLTQEHHYHYLFLQKTLPGPPDTRLLTPLLLFARQTRQYSTYADSLLAKLGLANLEIHPGYQLRVQTLGTLHTWRGAQEVPFRAWQRKKAQQLFLLFLTHRNHLWHREQICDMLWPELAPDEAARDFKIAYSAMCDVLEPHRKRHAPSSFVTRKGVRYGLRPEADIWIDADEFVRFVQAGDKAYEMGQLETAVLHYRHALTLYRGDYLQAYPYDEWCNEERDRLLALFIRTSERLAQALLEQNGYEEAILLCQGILARDNCWEQAYRLLITAYGRLGDRAQALRTYERCVEMLKNEWGVEPAPATTHLYQTILKTV